MLSHPPVFVLQGEIILSGFEQVQVVVTGNILVQRAANTLGMAHLTKDLQ